MATLYLYPTSVVTGASSSWDPSAGTDANRFQLVDDVQGSPDDNTTYIYLQNGRIGTHEILFESSTSTSAIDDADTINSVTIHYRMYKTETGNIQKLYGRISDGTNTSTEPSGNNIPTSYTDFSYEFGTDPNGGGWTKADLTGLEFGVYYPTSKLLFEDNPDIRVTQVYLEVDYTPAAAGTDEVKRVTNTIDLDKIFINRVGSSLTPEATAIIRGAHLTALQVTTAGRVAQGLEFEPPQVVSDSLFVPDDEDENNGVGDWETNTASQTNIHVAVDDYAPVVDADYVINVGSSAAVGDRCLFTCNTAEAALSLASYHKIRIRFRYKGDTDYDFKVALNSNPAGGTTYLHDTVFSPAGGLNYNGYVEFDAPPWGGSDWGGVSIDSFSFGWEVTAMSGVGDLRITQIWLEVFGADGINHQFKADKALVAGYTESSAVAAVDPDWIHIRENDDNVYLYTSADLATGNYISIGTYDQDNDLEHTIEYGLRVTVREKSTSSANRSFEIQWHDGGATYTIKTVTWNNTAYETHVIDIPDPPPSKTTWAAIDTNYLKVSCSSGSAGVHTVSYMSFEFYKTTVVDRLSNQIYQSKTEQPVRASNGVQFDPTFSAPWWDADYKRREPIEFNGTHDAYEIGDTARVPVFTGYEQKIADNGAANESIVHAGRMLFEFNGRVYICWLGDSTTTSNYSCWFAVKTAGVWGSPIEAFDAGTSDVHYYPTMVVDTSGVLHCFYGAHTSPLKYQRTGTSGGFPDMSFTAQTDVTADSVTYPRPIMMSNGDLVVFMRHGYVGTYPTDAQAWCRSTDGGDTWSSPVDYAFYDGYSGPPSLYCGGVYVDANDRIYTCLCWWDDYLGVNKGRTVSVQYTDDLIDWYAMDGTQIGGASDYIEWSDFENSGNGVDFCMMAGSVPSGNADDQASDWFTTGPFTHNNNESLIVDKRGYPHCVFTLWTDEIEEACELVICSWNGTTWDYVKLNELTGAELAFHRRSGVIYSDNTTLYVYAFSLPPTGTSDEYFGAEIIRYQGLNYGTTWTAEYLTRNTSHGLGMMSVLQDKVAGQPRMVALGRGRDVYLLDDLFYPYALRSGNDVRVVRTSLSDGSYSHTEQERLPDRFQAEDTEIKFMLDSRVSANKVNQNGQSQSYIYMNHREATAPTIDVDAVFRFFDGFEAYASWSYLEGQGGWSGNGSIYFTPLHYEDTATNKVFAGQKSLKVWGLGASDLYEEQDFSADPLTRHNIEYLHWVESGGDSTVIFIELLDSVSGNELALGVANTLYKKRQNGGSWTTEETGLATTAYNKIKVRISSSGVSAWINDVQVVTNDTTVTQATHFRIGLQGGFVATSYLDNITITGEPETLGTVVTGTPEITETTATYPRLGQLIHAQKVQHARIAQALNGNKHIWKRIRADVQTEKTTAGRVATQIIGQVSDSRRVDNQIAGERTVSQRVAMRLTNDKAFVNRLIHTMLTDKIYRARLMNQMVPEKTVVDRICHAMEPEATANRRVMQTLMTEATIVKRICNELGLEATEYPRVMAALMVDKHLHTRVMNAIDAEASLAVRLRNAIILELTESARVANVADPQKVEANRIAGEIMGDKEVHIRIANQIGMKGLDINKVANTLDLWAVDSFRLSMECVTDKAVRVRLAQLLQGQVTTTARVMGSTLLEGQVTVRLANLLDLLSTNTIRVPSDIFGQATTIDRVAMDLAVQVTIMRRVANRVGLASGDTLRLDNLLQMEAAPFVRVMNTIGFEAQPILRIANSIAPEATAWTRVMNAAILESEVETRLGNYLQTERIDSSRMAGSAILEAIDYSHVAHSIAGQMAAIVRIGNSMSLDAAIQIRLANAMEDWRKTTGVRVSCMLIFIAPVQGAFVKRERIRAVDIHRESVGVVDVHRERIRQIGIHREKISAVGIDRQRIRSVHINRQRMLLSNDNRL